MPRARLYAMKSDAAVERITNNGKKLLNGASFNDWRDSPGGNPIKHYEFIQEQLLNQLDPRHGDFCHFGRLFW